ncbi:MAG: hypothetical protein IT350_06285 [Deltaproteobacteria bacterium]|nr:hypothetical protein [Deltaproteobacteria bacterium]
MRGRKCALVCAVVLCAFLGWVKSSTAAECVMSDPPSTLGDLFTDCADAAGFTNYFTADMEEDVDFEIDQMEAFKIGLDFSSDADPNTDMIEANNGEFRGTSGGTAGDAIPISCV